MPSSPARGLAVAAAAAALVVAVSGGAFAALGARQVSQSEDRADVSGSALAAGRQIAVDLAAYDYRHLDQDFRRVSDDSTGTFREQFQKASQGLQELFIKSKSVSTGEVAAAAVAQSSPTRATVLISVDRTVRTATTPQGQKDTLDFQLVLVRSHGRWLASQVHQL
jgi:Mce-associated membrane protein